MTYIIVFIAGAVVGFCLTAILAAAGRNDIE